MQAEDFHDSIKPGLVAMLPRLMRFADVIEGDREAGKALLSRALRTMLAEQHRYQRGTALDVWAFGEVYRYWLRALRGHADPLSHAKLDGERFCELFHPEDEGYLDEPIVSFLGGLPTQQRLTLLLVYGEGFEHDDAARVLDVPPETVAARLVRISGALADRLMARTSPPAAAVIETLYPEGVRGSL